MGSISGFDAADVNIRPKTVYGLRTDVLGNIHFSLDQDVIYPVEGVLTLHDYVNKTQRFMKFEEDVNPLIIQISSTRKILAVLEDVAKQGQQISLYDLETLKKRRSLSIPKYESQRPIIQMHFVNDSKSIVLLTKPPDELLLLFSLETFSSVYESRPTMSFSRGYVQCFACHPTEINVVAVGGDSILLFMNKSEKGFNIMQNIKINFQITTMAFYGPEMLWLGTNKDELIIIDNYEIVFRTKASIIEVVDLGAEVDTLDKQPDISLQLAESLHNSRVLCMTVFRGGICFSIFNRVYVFEKVYGKKFERKTVLTIPVQLYPDVSYQIHNIALDPKAETVIVTTKHAQIYVGVLIVPETLKTKFLEFEPLGSLLHIANIVHVSVCAWKPIIMTASTDQTVRIWNYQNGSTELVRKFQVDVFIAELNALGLTAALAFNEQLRIAQIFMDELNIIKTYNFPHCKVVKFAKLGHYMAVAYDNNIAITSVFYLDVVKRLEGHESTILCLCWAQNDKYLLSGGSDGVIFQWDIKTTAKVWEIQQKGVIFRSICCTNSPPYTVYAATNHGVIREFQADTFVQDINIPCKQKCSLVDICLSSSDLIMFVTNELGELFNVRMPLEEQSKQYCKSFPFHISQINKIIFTYDSLNLITISHAGTLSIWTLENVDLKVLPIDPDLLRSQEVLIPRSILKEKNERIWELERSLKKQVEDFQYQVSQNEISDGQAMAEVHRDYCKALEELAKKNQEIEARHAEEIAELQKTIIDIQEKHNEYVQTISNQNSERLLVEYKKFSELRDSMLELRESYEDKFKKSTLTLKDTVEDLEENYKTQLDERRQTIKELLKEMSDKKVEFMEFCHTVEIEHDRNMVELQLKYESKLNTERNEASLWQNRTETLHEKWEYHNTELKYIIKEVENLKKEHYTNKEKIAVLEQDIQELQKNVTDRDTAINVKEDRIQDLSRKNIELDKYKKVLTHKINELKAQIEPRQSQIIDKGKHILEIEGELAGLKQNNMQLDLQLKELKDKYISNMAELKLEQQRSKSSKECIQNLCSEVYHLAQRIDNPHELKIFIKDMFKRHSSDSELRRFVSTNPEIRDEFQRQRALIERVLAIYHYKEKEDIFHKKYKKILKDHKTLLEEVETQRADYEKLKNKMELLKRSSKDMPSESVSKISNETPKEAGIN